MSPQQQSPAEAPKRVEHPKTPVSMNDKLAAKNFLTIMAVVTVAVVIIGGYFIYQLGKTYVRTANEVKAQDKQISALKKKQTDLETLKPAYNSIIQEPTGGISDAELVLRAVPISEDYKSLIASLEKIGQESGVKVTSVSQTASTATSTGTTGQAKSFGFTVNLEGPYDKIFTFLQNTERSARVMNFSNMTLSGNSGTVTASLSMKTYWQSPADISDKTEPLR
jgi:Tfp pilus assembly protein PilO